MGNRKTSMFALALTFVWGCASAAPAPGREVTFETKDGITIHADVHEIRKDAPLILLFHQGGASARGEYAPIIPWLLENGFNVMAIDQRLGAEMFGGVNRTKALVGDRGWGYCDAYPDVEAALRYAGKRFTARPFLWGSSYSATLAIRLAAAHPDEVSGVLAFSPAGGEPMKGCDPGMYVGKLKVPLLVLRPASEMERPTSSAQAEMFREHGVEVFVAKNGVHGSSMLVAERVEGAVDETRARVLSFLRRPRGNQ